jgi:hypothetical protein
MFRELVFTPFFFKGFAIFGTVVGATLGLQYGLDYIKKKAPEYMEEFEKLQRLQRYDEMKKKNPDPIVEIRNPDGSITRERIVLDPENKFNDVEFTKGNIVSIFLATFI